MRPWSVPPLWAGETVVCLGGGPSLTPEQADLCRGKARAIAINNALFLAPWADLHYVCDRRWMDWHGNRQEVETYEGLRVTLDTIIAEKRSGWLWLENDDGNGRDGLSGNRTALKTGRNSGYQVINLAVHLGAARILLLGYDMRAVEGRTHWHGDHPTPTRASIYPNVMLPGFGTLVEPLKARGVDVINCTPGSALDVFPKRALQEALRADSLQPRPA